MTKINTTDKHQTRDGRETSMTKYLLVLKSEGGDTLYEVFNSQSIPTPKTLEEWWSSSANPYHRAYPWELMYIEDIINITNTEGFTL